MSVWTEERVTELRKLVREGHSVSQIAKALGGGVSRNGVLGKIHRMGLAGQAPPGRPRRLRAQPKPRPKLSPAAKAAVRTPARPVEVKPPPARPLARKLLDAFEPLPGARLVSLADIGPDHCRWPHGTREDRRFCGCAREEGSWYCKAHEAVAKRPAGEADDE